MVWEPYALAVVFGLVVSAAIYFVIMWPQVEPDDDAEEPGSTTTTTTSTTTTDVVEEPAADA